MKNQLEEHKYSKIMGIDDYCISCHRFRVFIEDKKLSKEFEKLLCKCACHNAYSQTDASIFKKQSCKHCNLKSL